MRTLDELMYYCEEPEPVGAVLLTGEWDVRKHILAQVSKETILDIIPSCLENVFTQEKYFCVKNYSKNLL